MNQDQTFKCYYREKNSNDLLQKFVDATSAGKAGEILEAMGIQPLGIEQVDAHRSVIQLQLARQVEPEPSLMSGAEQRSITEPRAASALNVPETPKGRALAAGTMRLVAAIIFLVVTIFVNLAGYAPGAWIIGVLILVLTALPLIIFADKLDTKM